MPISPSRGEMYPFIDGTHNIIKGGCWNILHGFGCRYCYVGIKELGRGQYGGKFEIHQDEFKVQYKPGKYYFIGSAIDMFHPNIPDDWIGRVLSHCRQWVNHTPGSLMPPKFLFQSKNPERFRKFIGEFPRTACLATTVETDDEELYGDMSRAPKPLHRLQVMTGIHDSYGSIFPMMLSIEPIMKFRDVEGFVDLLSNYPWSLISIGADSCEAISLEKQPDVAFIGNLAERLNELRSVGNIVLKQNCLNLTTPGLASEYLQLWDARGWIYHRQPAKEKKVEQGVLF